MRPCSSQVSLFQRGYIIVQGNFMTGYEATRLSKARQLNGCETTLHRIFRNSGILSEEIWSSRPRWPLSRAPVKHGVVISNRLRVRRLRAAGCSWGIGSWELYASFIGYLPCTNNRLRWAVSTLRGPHNSHPTGEVTDPGASARDKRRNAREAASVTSTSIPSSFYPLIYVVLWSKKSDCSKSSLLKITPLLSKISIKRTIQQLRQKVKRKRLQLIRVGHNVLTRALDIMYIMYIM